jgi:hypothetical protein
MDGSADPFTTYHVRRFNGVSVGRLFYLRTTQREDHDLIELEEMSGDVREEIEGLLRRSDVLTLHAGAGHDVGGDTDRVECKRGEDPSWFGLFCVLLRAKGFLLIDASSPHGA